ncbi:hypothetical protein Pelo_12005 [Pelomyxa schiedti]|nr:hypothetical protein Pelo_12005 [Pelomyxa schiedti]
MSCAPEYLRNPLLPRLESDRWSYGMVLWEMWSNCNTPYHDHHISSPCELCDFLESGNRLKINSNWLQQIQQIIKECWDANPFCRPPFSRIQHDLGWVVSTTKQTSSTGTSSLPEGLGDTKQAEKPSFEAHTSETQEPESREITPASCSEPSPGSQNPTEQPRPCGTPSVPPIPNCVEVARNTAEVLPSVSQLYREIAMKMLETAGSKECTQPDNHKRVASRLHLLVVAQQIVLTLVLLLMLIFGSPKAVTVGCVTLLLMTQLFFLSVFYSKNREKDAHKHM